MKLSHLFLRRHIIYVTFMFMALSQLGFVPLFALSSTFTVSEIQANIKAIQSVTTFTVNTAGINTDILTLDSCNISFVDFGTADTDCTDGIGIIDTITNISVDQQATALAGFTFTNYIASTQAAGTFILNYSGSPIDGNTTSAELGTLSVSEVSTTPGIATSMAQIVDFVPLSPTVGETFQAIINATNYYHSVVISESTAETVTALHSLMMANVSTSCVDNFTKITCTANTPGTPFAASARSMDNTAPIATLTMSATSPTNGPFMVTATFSESVTGVDITDFVVGNGTTSAFTPVSATEYTVLVTPTVSGIVTIDMPTRAAVDPSGNDSNDSIQISIVYDGGIPSVVLSTVLPTVTGPFMVTATFSESVTGVDITDFVVGNGTTSAFTPVSATEYTVLVTPTVYGLVTINMPTAAAGDTAGNSSSVATQGSVIYKLVDITPPVVTLIGSISETIAYGFPYVDSGGLWTDNIDGSGTIVSASSGSVNVFLIGDYTLEYTYTDTSSNIGNSVWRTVTVSDQTPPVVILLGLPMQSILQGATYIELGASWIDTVDGSGTLTVASSGSVNTAIVGNYILEYGKTDGAGNVSLLATRTVTIIAPSTSTSAYLGGGGGTYTPSTIVPIVSLENSASTIIQSVPSSTRNSFLKTKIIRKPLKLYPITSTKNIQRIIPIKTPKTQIGPVTGTRFLVTASRLNIRNEGTPDAVILGSLLKDKSIVAIREYNGWIEFKIGKNTGWVNKYFLIALPKE